jgi:hypothetical protein
MNSRDDFHKEKSYFQTGHKRGKSMNNASIESINLFRESSKNNNINMNYTKSTKKIL